MIAALRFLLLGIVLLNLAFVQFTRAVSGHWMAALWLATAVAPLLVAWHERLLYRVAWNGVVLVSFAFLVNDAMTSGLLHMLEDGLLLAALCQVHLLNNVGERQRPDLLFFNSFLIAFVTSFFCGDLEWSLCFCAYAALLVPTLQLFVVLPRDGRHAQGAVRALLRDGAPRGALAIALTGAVFVLLPRDFERDGWLGDTLAFGNQQVVAFAEEVRLDRQVTPTLSDAVVMRVRGPRDLLPSHWRGITFVQFDGAGWQPYRAYDFGTRGATDPPWQAVARNRWLRSFTPAGPMFEVRLVDQGAHRLFLPVEACEVVVPPRDTAVLLDPKADAVLAVDEYSRGDRDLVVQVRLGRAPRPDDLARRAATLLVQLPQHLPRTLRDLATTLRAELPADAGADAIAGHSRDWLAGHRRYALPGTPGAAKSLDDFVLGTGGGHCEYFATTLALLLRLQGVACRLAGGYLAHEWDEQAGELVVRQKDAHAWVELLSPTGGWRTIDATPADPAQEDRAGGWWQDTVALLRGAWARVASFGAADRKALFAWFVDLPGRTTAAAAAHPVATALLLLLAGIGVGRLRGRRRGVEPTVARLRAALRDARIEPRPGETPRESLVRANAESPRPTAVAALATAVAAHEAARYAVDNHGHHGRQPST